MTGYRFLSVSHDEMSEAAVFYETRCIGLGSNFLDDVQQTIDKLRAHPNMGVEVAGNFRSVLLHRFPFSLIYSLESDGILIISIAHHRRRPCYWRSRTSD